jgi:hypothetical protein
MQVVGTGFLSPEGLEEAARLEQSLRDILALASRSIDLCHEGLVSVVVDGQDTPQKQQHVIACLVLARLLEISEAVVVLAKGGFSVEVEATTRTFLEAYFLFGNVCKDAGFVPKYFAADLTARQKLINQASKHKDSPFKLTNDYGTPEVKAELKRQIEELGAEPLDAYKNASNVGCAGVYDSLYRVASAATHSTPRALAGYVLESPDGTVTEVRRGPQLGGIGARLHDVGCFLLNVRTAFDELFGSMPSQEAATLRSQLEAVVLPP